MKWGMEKNFWDLNSQAWAEVLEKKTIASRAVTNAAIVTEIQRAQVRSILDVGCGEGWLSEPLQKAGLSYTGVDGSQGLIEIARNKYGPHFLFHSYEELIAGAWTPTKKFEAAVFNFSLFEKDLSPLLAAIKNLLIPGSPLFIQTLHPCFTLKPYEDGWRDEDFKTMSVPFQGLLRWYGRTLSSWAKLFAQTQLQIAHVTEPHIENEAVSILFSLTQEN